MPLKKRCQWLQCKALHEIWVSFMHTFGPFRIICRSVRPPILISLISSLQKVCSLIFYAQTWRYFECDLLSIPHYIEITFQTRWIGTPQWNELVDSIDTNCVASNLNVKEPNFFGQHYCVLNSKEYAPLSCIDATLSWSISDCLACHPYPFAKRNCLCNWVILGVQFLQAVSMRFWDSLKIFQD